MQRIANGTQVAALPAASAAVGTPGFGSNGNPSGGQQATIFDADTYNRIQEELINLILGAGLVPNGADYQQVLQAVRALRPMQMQVFNASGSWTVPAGVTRVKVRAWGGGGGGGGSGGASSAGAGGAGAGYVEQIFGVAPGAVIPYAVGAGGTRGSNAGGNGGVGGNTSFSSALASGAAGGIGGTSAIATPGPNGSGASGGAINETGQGGQTGVMAGGGSILGGEGGASYGFNGAAASSSNGSTPQPGQDAAFPGCGGSGGVSGGNGGLGGPGRLILEW